MKTTVEIPDDLITEARKYASARGKSFKDVLIEALDLLMFNGEHQSSQPGWESLFGAFRGDPGMAVVQAAINEEFSTIDPEDWK